MTAIADVCPIFENEDWFVTEEGLEHKTTGYFIERESIGQRREDGLWTWPLHMAEKSWCAMAPFAEAFSYAAAVYNVETDMELASTFKVARHEVSAWPQAQQPLRGKTQTPISLPSLSSQDLLQNESSYKFDKTWRLRDQTAAFLVSKGSRIRSARYMLERDPSPKLQATCNIR